MARYNLKYTGQEIDELLEKTEKGTLSFECNIATETWTNDTTYSDYNFKAIVAVEEVKSDDHIIVGLSEDATAEQKDACMAATVQCKEQSNGQITLYAKEKPKNTFPISVTILR